MRNPKSRKWIRIRLGVAHEIVQIHLDGDTCSMFHQLCCTVHRNGPAMGPAMGPAVALVKTLRLELAMRFCVCIAMGSQWACNGPTMGAHCSRHGACNGLLQWACNGNSNSCNVHFDVPAMGFSHVYIHYWVRFVDPIASPLQAHYRNRFAQTNSHPGNPLQTS